MIFLGWVSFFTDISSEMILPIRFIGRVGKGLRTASRDALIAESSEYKTRGRAFGIHRMMDTTGAVIGASVAFFLFVFTVRKFRL